MFSEFLAGLFCIFNFFWIISVVLLWRWTRRQVAALRTQLTAVEAQVAQISQASLATIGLPSAKGPLAETAPLLATPAEDAPGPDPVSAAQPPVEPDGEATPEYSAPAAKPPTTVEPPPWIQNPVVAWFVRVHLLVQAGIIVLFFGVGFLIKYAVDQGWFPLELRLAGASLLGLGLATIGWRVRKRQRTYGLALIGGGIGIVYLTTFGAYFFYDLLPALLAFTIFVLLAIVYALMAIWNEAPILALLAIVGAFLAPLLTADSSGNHLVLFSYYGVVNAGVLAIAWGKAWPGLNLVSFCFSLLAAVGWATTAYQPAYFASTELFLLLFFSFYLLITLWNALRSTRRSIQGELRVAEVILLFANPLASFGLQSALVAGREDWLAYTAFALAVLYLAVGLFNQQRRGAELFTQAAFFFAGFFLLIGVPLRFDPQVTAAFWAVQGAGQIWIGARRGRSWPQLWGTLVQLLAGGAFVVELSATQRWSLTPFLNHLYLGALILSIAAIMSATIVRSHAAIRRDKMAPLAYALFLLGLCWWYAGGIGQLAFYAERPDRLAILLLFGAASGLLGELYGALVQWWAPRLTLASVLPAAGLAALYMFAWDMHPFAYGWYVWPVILALHLLHLRRGQHRGLALYHSGGVWLATFLLTWWSVQQALLAGVASAWLGLAWLGLPAVALLLCGGLIDRLPWPVAGHQATYVSYAAAPVALFLLGAALWVNQTNPGHSTPLPFVPVLNPLDLLLGAVVVILWQWSWRLRAVLAPQRAVATLSSQWGVWLVSLWVVNLALARALHHLNGIPFTFTALYNSGIVQTTYALVWGLLALVFMYVAHHRHWRHVWSIGATLLGLTIIKLFLVDLAHTGSLARIISFIGVGLLTITVAYFWPAPPRDQHQVQTKEV